MSSESRPADVRTAARTAPSVDAVASPGIGPMLGAIVTLVLGAALGIANQAASGTSLSLRFPAILAAMLMVGQSVVDIKRHWPVRRPRPARANLVDDGSGAGPRPSSQVARLQPLPSAPVVTPVAVPPTPATLAVPLLLMVLSAWLGVADLRVAAPHSLQVLSLIAAFALFALGWTLLPARR